MVQIDIQTCASLASDAAEIPAGTYVEPGIFDLELRGLFRSSWFPVGRAEEISEHGAFFTWERTRVPLVMIRAADGQARAFYNSCRHRGAPVVRTVCGRARAFRCQYHSWTYDTFGRLMAVPDERDFGEVDRCAYSLIGLQLVEAAGWLWINQDPAGGSLSDSLGAARVILERHSTAVRFAERSHLAVAANWKAAVERIAGLLATPSAGETLLARHAPNQFFVRSGDELQLIAAWPRDEHTADLEVVRCAEGVSRDDALRARGTVLHARLAEALRDRPGADTRQRIVGRPAASS